MKTIMTVAIFALVTITSFAQVKPESSNHLLFKGVPIDGTLHEYVLKMERNGFTQMGNEDRIAVLKGDFASYKNCYVGVSTLEQKDLVSHITVAFPEQDTWSALSSDYFSLKELLTEKYGAPAEYVEKFDGYKPSTDRDRMYQVRFDNCKYYTIYETTKGTIQLSIEHESVISCYVQLTYYDKINGDTIKKKAIDDL